MAFPQPGKAQRPEFRSEEAMVDWLGTLVARSKGLAPSQAGPDASFVELGFDSLTAVSLAGSIEDSLGLELAPTLLWEHPTIGTLAAYLWTVTGPTSDRSRT